MNKKYIVVIAVIILMALSISVAFITKSPVEQNENSNNDIVNDNLTAAMQEFTDYLNSDDNLKADTKTYKYKVSIELRSIYNKLDNNTNTLLNGILDNATVNIDELLKNIQNDAQQFHVSIDKAYNDAKSNQYKTAYNALKKYMQLQNDTIYRLVEVYKKEGSISYDEYYEMLHETHGALSQEETNGINFLSAVDNLIEENN